MVERWGGCAACCVPLNDKARKARRKALGMGDIINARSSSPFLSTDQAAFAGGKFNARW